MNTYKDQFTEWSPAYPVFFHGVDKERNEANFKVSLIIQTVTLNTHNEAINAINKAVNK